MKKLRLSQAQNQILWILEVAGEESTRTIVVTLRSKGIQDDEAIETALDELERLSLVAIEGQSVALTPMGRAEMAK